MSLLGSKQHTAGDVRRWTLSYGKWLDNTATIVSADVTSSSETCTVMPAPEVLGKEVIFFLTGGTVGETLTVSVMMEDSFGNIKNDTVAYTVVAP
jgi:FKBP-type peptidyl-prolyl cis-trans isomerase 2